MTLRGLFVLGSLWCAWYVGGPDWGDQALSALFIWQASLIVRRRIKPVRRS